MGIMRIEKGHVTGAELDGRTTADDVGLGRMAGTKKWYVGRGMLDKPAFTDPDRPKLVGLVPVDGATRILAGSILVDDPDAPAPAVKLGHVTSSARSEEHTSELQSLMRLTYAVFCSQKPTTKS